MKINSELAEKPNHEHYLACLSRMQDINKICHRCFLYTLISGFILGTLTFFTLRFSVISIIPNLVGESTEVGSSLVQVAILLGMTTLSAVSVFKYKFCNVILFAIYCAMTVTSLFSREFADVFTFMVGAGGIIFTYRAYGVWCDYRQLMNTEGFPHFSLRLAEEDESDGYVPMYGSKIYTNNDEPQPIIDIPEVDVSEISKDETDSSPEMEELSLDFINKKSAEHSIIYAPRGKKYCAFSECPLKLSKS